MCVRAEPPPRRHRSLRGPEPPSRRLAARYLLLPLPSDLAGGGTIDLSRIRFADPGAFGHRHGRTSSTLAVKVDHGFRRLLGL
jgi:hypothetical protein